jgi:hypothetical protein
MAKRALGSLQARLEECVPNDGQHLKRCAVQNEINSDKMKCMWNKMALNVHSFCNNKL